MCHTGIGGQDEQDGLRCRQHLVGQFRFAADGVESRRVEDAQALRQQRVSDIELGQAPARNAHLRRTAIFMILKKAEFCGFALTDKPVFGQHLQSFGE